MQGAVGATTVGGTLAACKAAGIRFMATGGLGGVHRGWPTPPDVSADLSALARDAALVVSSGVKSLLDVAGDGGAARDARRARARLAHRHAAALLLRRTAGRRFRRASSRRTRQHGIAATHWQLGGGGLLLGRPPDESLDDVEPLIEQALAAAAVAGRARPGA